MCRFIHYLTLSITVTHIYKSNYHQHNHVLLLSFQVIINLWGLHHNGEFWPEPFVFKPVRFLDDDGHIIPPNHPKMRQHVFSCYFTSFKTTVHALVVS